MLALAHVRMRLQSLLRTPAYVVGTLALPSLILVFLASVSPTRCSRPTPSWPLSLSSR